MIIDEVRIKIKAGHGGAGKVAFNTVPKSLGPTGGNGGRGGSIYLEGVSDLSYLRQYRFKKEFKAEDGGAGGAANREGRAGEDFILKVPIGTVVHVVKDMTDRGEDSDVTLKTPTLTDKVEITEVGQRLLIAKGGKGGKGNFEFRSSRKTSPTYAQSGLPGEEYEVLLELQMIADIGLIGLPNAGKSSLLNELTKAGAKVANYPFTTLEPNLGVYYPTFALKASDEEQKKIKPLILADIPGLIEGASSGKGLGTKFLRHIQRTKAIIHCISAESNDVAGDYKSVRAELSKHNKVLTEKESYILLTKTDLADEATLKKQMTALGRFSAKGGSSQGEKKSVLAVSIYNPEQINKLKELLDGFK